MVTQSSLLSPPNPRSGRATTTIQTTPTEVLPQLIVQARQAGRALYDLSLAERSQRLLHLARLITERSAEGAALIHEETGRPSSMAALSELNNVMSFAKAAIQEAKIALRVTKAKLSPLDFPGKSALISQVPRGIIALIAPWNYPASNFYKSLFPALLSGNAVIMKPSELTPRTGAWLASLAQEVFGEDTVQCIQGGGEVGAALIASGVDAVVFTGSVSTGRKVAEACARQLIPCSLELGGKDAALVLNDASLDRTALGIAQWSMFNSGQDCSSIERIYVEEGIADQFIDHLVRVISQLTTDSGDVDGTEGEPLYDLGPLQSQAQLETVIRHVDEAVADGAVIRCGGHKTEIGYGFQPTVLDRCTDKMNVVTEETFGPVIAVIRVAHAEEGLQLINAAQYGLNASVWTQDVKRGAQLAQQFECGVALVNNHSFTGSLPQIPWTGVKNTGYGVASSRWAYSTFTRPQTVVIDKNKDPDPFWFPIDESYRQFVEAIALKNLGGGLGVVLRLLKLLKTRIKATKSLLNKS